jgi:hypothetical protein
LEIGGHLEAPPHILQNGARNLDLRNENEKQHMHTRHKFQIREKSHRAQFAVGSIVHNHVALHTFAETGRFQSSLSIAASWTTLPLGFASKNNATDSRTSSISSSLNVHRVSRRPPSPAEWKSGSIPFRYLRLSAKYKKLCFDTPVPNLGPIHQSVLFHPRIDPVVKISLNLVENEYSEVGDVFSLSSSVSSLFLVWWFHESDSFRTIMCVAYFGLTSARGVVLLEALPGSACAPCLIRICHVAPNQPWNAEPYPTRPPF